MILHADANSFYASCEQIYRPDLREKPVAVLSNNDGVIIALNKEAKACGIKRDYLSPCWTTNYKDFPKIY